MEETKAWNVICSRARNVVLC